VNKATSVSKKKLAPAKKAIARGPPGRSR
jgi:hypothetical protein